MSLLVAAAAPPQIRQGAAASPSESSGDEFAGVLAGTSSAGEESPTDAPVTPHALAKPHPAAKMQKVHSEDEPSGSDGNQVVQANPSPVALPPQRHQDIAGHRAKADETSSSAAIANPDGTATGAAPTTAAAEGASTAADSGAGKVAGTAAALATAAEMTAAASMPAGLSSAAGAAQPAAAPASAGGSAVTAPATSGPAAMQASATGTPLAAGLATKPAKSAPVAPAVAGAPVPVPSGAGSARPASTSLGGSVFTRSMLASLQALGTEVPALGWLGGVHAPGSSGGAVPSASAPATDVMGGIGTAPAPGAQGAHAASSHPAPALAAAVDTTPAAAPGQVGPVPLHSQHSAAAQALLGNARVVDTFPASSSATATAQPDASGVSASAANASAANASAATASAQAAGQVAAQPVTAAGLQGAAGQSHAMTSTPTQVWTAAEPLGPQLTSSVLPLRAGGDGSHQLIIALHPEQLGPVNVHVRILGDAMTIQLASGTQDAHETLRAALPELRHELQAAGLGTAQLSLDGGGGGTTGFSDSSGQRESSRNGRNAVANPVAEPVIRTTRANVPRATGAIDSGLDRWL